ncbi:OLC1v1038136C1 [Oldenlandia corymbosa var. corymbosa]|uniref:OLC1v1038136C1 n=1 Tax=Oldenlandia corymbosa var. corymbosa TaxID=529605 RepID=A0AAV1CZ82_OLDCO|nr:OLC1v1038136C1 [Oldenlandia corymbosa var. corymbosa]
MGVKERTGRWLFWAERVGFLIMAFLWVAITEWRWLTPESYRLCITNLKLFWKCTNSLYLLVFASQGLFRFWTKLHNSSSSANSTPNLIINRPTEEESLSLAAAASLLFEQLAVLIWETGIWVVKHPGFLLERLALLIWFCGAEYRDDLPDYWILQSCHTIFFPFLNIYFAWNGYSKEFQHDFHHHHHQKNHHPSSEQVTYRRAELVLFWVERLGFFTLALGWLFIRPITEILRQEDLWDTYITIIGCFWQATNLIYFTMYIGKLLGLVSRRGGKKKKGVLLLLVNNFKRHPGFWLERLAILIFVYALHRSVGPNNEGKYVVLDSCISVIFPLLHIYLAGFGPNEFQLADDIHDVEVPVPVPVPVNLTYKEKKP